MFAQKKNHDPPVAALAAKKLLQQLRTKVADVRGYSVKSLNQADKGAILGCFINFNLSLLAMI